MVVNVFAIGSECVVDREGMGEMGNNTGEWLYNL